MAPRRFQITADQETATQRHDLEGVVYLLSGTLKGRRVGVTDINFRWSTQTFSGALGAFEAYLGPPATILRAQRFLPGEGADTPAVRIPIRNLAFASGASLLALIDDGTYAWEDSEASLRVGYLKPGQVASGLAANDWAFLVKDGFLGAPEQIDIDGFQLPIWSRTAARNRAFKQPRMPGTEWIRSNTATLTTVPLRDLGVPLPFVIGKPDSWYRPPILLAGVRGTTVSAYSAGDRQITFLLSTAGGEATLSGALGAPYAGFTLYGSALSGMATAFFIHRQNPVYGIFPLGTSGTTWSETSGTITMLLVSALAADVPKGALVIEAAPYRLGYAWPLAGHPLLMSGEPDDQAHTQGAISITSGNVGFQFSDGTVRLADRTAWQFGRSNIEIATRLDTSQFPEGVSGSTTSLSALTLNDINLSGSLISTDQDAIVRGSPINIPPPVWFDTDYDPTKVTQQPAFTSTATLTKINYPTGGTGTGNATIRDGAVETGITLLDSETVSVTFNSAPAPFADSDTIESHLFIWAEGDLLITNSTGSVTFATIAQQGPVILYRFTQSTPRDFNETIRMVGQTGGATIAEVWWEHTLSAEVENTRTADVVITAASGVSGVRIGAPLEPSELVFRVASQRQGFQATTWFSRNPAQGYDEKFEERDNMDPLALSALLDYPIAYPTSTMLAMQAYFLGPRFGSFLDVNSGVYRVAHDRYIQEDIRMGFVLQRTIGSWSELERDFSLQARAQCYYGPSGHEMVFMDVASEFTASGVVQEFRLPGVPGANSMKAGQRSLMERTRTDEIVNRVTLLWNEDYLRNNFSRTSVGTHGQSADLFGERRDPRGDLRMWGYSVFQGHPTFNAAVVVSGIAQFYADRGAFALTRFSISTAWIAYGVERGSPVRMVYQVAIDPDDDVAYRNVACEVEEIRVDPGAAERYQMILRAVETPARGLPAFTWIDRFDDETDLWTDEIAANDAWRDRWSIP